MQVIVNDTVHEVPFDLAEIKLGQYVDYYEQYGRELDNQLNDLLEKKYEGEADVIELERQFDLDRHIDNEALAWYSFFTGNDFFEAKEQKFIEPLLNQYRILRFLIKESLEEAKNFPLDIIWNDEVWQVQDFKINPASELSFNEIITSKEIMRQMYKIGKGKWDGMPYLCAIYFRKKGEPFEDTFVHEGSDRLQLMRELPMTHALQVAFFLSICVKTWSNSLAYSEEKEEAGSLN